MSKTYKTVQGEMWDEVSMRFYGKEKYVHLLLDANLQHAGKIIFEGGEELRIPDISLSEEVKSESLPPWRR